MTSAIRTSALISPVFTCEMASASRRTCNIRCFTQLFVVNMIARPIWAKDVKFGVRCFCLGYLRPLLYRDTLKVPLPHYNRSAEGESYILSFTKFISSLKA